LADITIVGDTLETYQFSGTTHELRIKVSEGFTASDGTAVNNGEGFYQSVSLTSGGVYSTFSIKSTRDGVNLQNCSYTFQIWIDGEFRQNVSLDGMTQFIVPASPATQSLSDLATATRAYLNVRSRNLPDGYFTQSQSDTRYAFTSDARFISSFTYAALSLLTVVVGTIQNVSDRLRGLYYKTKATIWCSLTGRANVLDHDATGDGTTDCRSALNALLNTTLATAGGIVHFPHYQNAANTDYLVSSNLSVPANVTLELAAGARLKAATGATVTVLGDIRPTRRQIFTWAGTGALSFAGNKLIDTVYAAWWGVADGVESTALIQKILDRLYADNFQNTLKLPPGELIIGGALQDVSGANSQIKLPSGSESQQYAITIEGTGTPSMMGLGVAAGSTVLRSTLSTGNGAVIGAYGTAFAENRAVITPTFRDLTFRLPPNPTNSALDVSHVVIPRGFNLRFTTGEEIDAVAVEPTGTAAAIKMPRSLAGAGAYFESIAISGVPIGLDWTELARAKNVTIANCRSGLYVRDAPHGSIMEGLLSINNKYDIDVDPSATFHTFIRLDMDTERYVGAAAGQPNKWFNSVAEVNDPNNALRGELVYHVDYPDATIIADIVKVGGRYLVERPAYKPYWNRYPAEIFTGFRAQDNAVTEIKHGAATSGVNNVAWLSFVTNQTGTGQSVGVISASNSSLATADKRIGAAGFVTGATTDAGTFRVSTRASAGALTERLIVDAAGDVDVLTAGKGVVLKSPDGTVCKRLGLDNAGALVLTTVTCP
jgi:hypothetical protein